MGPCEEAHAGRDIALVVLTHPPDFRGSSFRVSIHLGALDSPPDHLATAQADPEGGQRDRGATGAGGVDHRRAYLNAARRFAAWCEEHQIRQLAEVQPVHVAAFIQDLRGQLAPASVKQHLAPLRILFDWLVTGQVLQLNPAHSVRGPSLSGQNGCRQTLAELRALDRSPYIGACK